MKGDYTSGHALNTLMEVTCSFCNGKHKSNSCDLNLEERKNSLRKKDTGSARTFITRGLPRRLGLTVKGQEELKIIAFGGKEDTQSIIPNRVRFLLTDEKKPNIQ
ncbi:hypothetical protein CEXT_692431 [Caerostris extrusa]|uniref:Uncharacterized protein n=1 Tax=Caerostris extrusa TaxID=172846 RepID=A0AAV4R1A9_CAEEX|nr:hypothetical protein CEXT_692431 [Caerostris extrusa]